MLLLLPLRQFVFTIPKCLRPYFVHNRTLFSDISHLIFELIQDYYIVKLAPEGWKEKKELEAVSEEGSLDNTALAYGPQPNTINLYFS